jgi:hypothetical protein
MAYLTEKQMERKWRKQAREEVREAHALAIHCVIEAAERAEIIRLDDEIGKMLADSTWPFKAR